MELQSDLHGCDPADSGPYWLSEADRAAGMCQRPEHGPDARFVRRMPSGLCTTTSTVSRGTLE